MIEKSVRAFDGPNSHLTLGAIGHCATLLHYVAQWPDVMEDRVFRKSVLVIAQAFNELNDKILK
jgi:hypothetical protein